ncbi:MAG: HEAT repeat domain-containing protein, partial [Deltaproteobacteria bacterium]|nr:HEAT repeat domain-containing protein [Deltaproteobacteria bacterium]
SVEENIEILRDWSRPWIDRNEAARELGEASGADSVRALKRALEEDPESFVRREAALSLGKIGDANAVKVLTNATNNDDDEWVAKYANEALSMIANPNKSVKRSTTSPANEWVVNVASYTSRSEADATSEMLREMDFAPYITEFTLNGTLWYRVRVGFFKSRASADSTKSLIAHELNITDAWSVKAAPSELSRH